MAGYTRRDPNKSTRFQRFDPLHKSTISNDIVHSKIHEGNFFHAIATNLGMGNNDTLCLAFKIPEGNIHAHVRLEFTSLVGGSLDLIEDATWNALTGELNPIHNRNRIRPLRTSILMENKTQISFVPTNNLILNPLNLQMGTIIRIHTLVGVRNQSQAGTYREPHEWVLDSDTQYAFLFISDSNQNTGEIKIGGYIHENE